jgi:formate hydrogenlyase subunit 3/multisubunit Na+/H+ antiporter MnhD subunit
MFFGVLFLALGVTAYLLTDSMHRSQLAPAVLGVVLLLCGALANTEDSRRRMLWMHVAVTLGLLGFLASGALVVMAFVWAHGEPFGEPMTVESRGAMCVLCAIFVGLCVRSFIAARRSRATAS